MERGEFKTLHELILSLNEIVDCLEQEIRQEIRHEIDIINERTSTLEQRLSNLERKVSNEKDN